ncbi:hypothetical protein EJF18_40098 [Clavispora lusitaniae]|uniref:Uncharacterized protein n=2 Tax=Clavispora lusitaniae TaxID=36911 RepID=C4Y563_CLAL4|nr:uncharacterized protein CLUG_03297 [Clavispora lusitaniae ATCC 42720]QFZ28074.1 hypothetical protein EJF14_40098 [Clavispora lusitaniae]EEQ39170.1 hypothetical protein CLUG_03297 [Clavispora lusitaniae ATCC 42720]QFZ33737.1 hypothetical protein EJF16_40098 [Clavispora lusitaniae]QFZ39421.1 hypothetical protein EJF15_40098 [Clavispora lusitaniae]QFZ45103.1 hypothetical protein EJF18_40098 [Clavispora lusitaniae]
MLQHLAGILRLADAMGALQLLRQTGFLANLRSEDVLVDALDRRQVEPVLAAVLGERIVVQGHKIQRIHLGLVVGPVRVDMFGKKFESGGSRHSVPGLVGRARRCSCFGFGLGRRFSVVGTGRHSVDFYLFRVEQRCSTGGPGVFGPRRAWCGVQNSRQGRFAGLVSMSAQTQTSVADIFSAKRGQNSAWSLSHALSGRRT